VSGAETTSATASQLDPATCFTGRIKRVWLSPLYLVGLVLVAGAMVLLPVAYVGIVALVGYGLFYYATHCAAWIGAGHVSRGGLFLLLGPLVAGGILFFFMVKPLFAPRSRRDRRISLVRANEPLLFAFVDRLCEVVGSPKPRRIDVDCQVNASASFRHGIWSILWPGDLVLTIGVPLAAGLSLRDFTGVLAHEFGHFAQGLGMRFFYVIGSINGWFARVVYQRDAWDEWLVERIEQEEGWIRVIMYVARIFVFITRLVLFLLMVLGHMISCGLSRQMEFDADLHAIRTTGSASQENTELHMVLLSRAYSAVFEDLRASWRDRKLGDNLPALVALKAEDFPAEKRSEILDKARQEKAGWFDTHPSPAARIRFAQKVADPGVFTADGSAAALFSDFEGLSRSITLAFYQQLIGPEFTAKNLVATADVTRGLDQARSSREAADRYFCGGVSLRRPLRLDAHSEIFKLDEASARGKLNAARNGIARHAAAIRDRYRRFQEADARHADLAIMETAIKAGKELDPQKCGLSACTTEAVVTARRAVERERRTAAEDLIRIEAVMRTRAEAALRLLSADAVARRVRGIERLQRRTRELLATLTTVGGVADTLLKLRQGIPCMDTLSTLLTDEKPTEERVRQALRLAESQHMHLHNLRSILANGRYPFAHTAGRITLAEYAVAKLPERDDFGGVYGAADEAVEAMEQLYARLLGEVARICEAVEAALGYPPIQTAPLPPAATPEAA